MPLREDVSLPYRVLEDQPSVAVISRENLSLTETPTVVDYLQIKLHATCWFYSQFIIPQTYAYKTCKWYNMYDDINRTVTTNRLFNKLVVSSIMDYRMPYPVSEI